MTPSDLTHQPSPHPPALPVSALDQDNDIDIPDADDVEDLKIAAAHKRQDSFSSQARSHSRSSSIGGASFGSIEEDNTGTSPFCRLRILVIYISAESTLISIMLRVQESLSPLLIPRKATLPVTRRMPLTVQLARPRSSRLPSPISAAPVEPFEGGNRFVSVGES